MDIRTRQGFIPFKVGQARITALPAPPPARRKPAPPKRVFRHLPPEPTRIELAANFLTALAKWTAAGFSVVDQSSYQARALACAGDPTHAPCGHWDGQARAGLGKCTHPKCGCTRAKWWLATEKCPLQKWPA